MKGLTTAMLVVNDSSCQKKRNNFNLEADCLVEYTYKLPNRVEPRRDVVSPSYHSGSLEVASHHTKIIYINSSTVGAIQVHPLSYHRD
uniref:Uncharacterized protein n=1 Tax=Timema poppense TaxID=170557 RepID=A0A7R9DJW7_TIMPO|nr:unnamed protein product [Timema poppensis]